ncbi:MAG: dehypoxanthine futalosine cyclase [Peptococcaceae bacterium]|nr:dehypoxanthine futalosine cyclase [Peptococcaceae bacterium]
MNNAKRLLEKAAAGERLTLDEGVEIYRNADLLDLGRAAGLIRKRIHPENRVTFVIDRNINYTNICSSRCKFCAFYRDPGHPEAYVISKAELFGKIEETLAAGGTGVLIQGGLNPDLGLDYFLDMLRSVKSRYDIHIHSFSPPEVVHMAEKSGLTAGEVIGRLKDAGLDSLPGGGAEILADRVRELISPAKISWRRWMEVMREAHRRGMKTTATMMFGHVETAEERVLHMVRVREVQDETGGFTAFIPWSFQPGNTRLGGSPATGADYLRTLSLARIMLDNVPNIQASWVTQGAKLAQVALAFGANDFGSTMLEENVVRAAGVTYRVPLEEIVRCIRDAGFRPVQRTNLYQVVREY